MAAIKLSFPRLIQQKLLAELVKRVLTSLVFFNILYSTFDLEWTVSAINVVYDNFIGRFIKYRDIGVAVQKLETTLGPDSALVLNIECITRILAESPSFWSLSSLLI